MKSQLTALALVSIASLTGLSGCTQRRAHNPYTPVSETERDGQRAQKLNAEATKLMDKDLVKAEKLLRDALIADLFHGPAHNNLGVLFLKQGRLYEAAGEFEWAKKLLPGLPDPRMNLALTLERAGRTDEALATYATALEVYPDHLPTIEAIALLQMRSGKIDENTNHLLDEIALRGENERWREWAKLQRAKRGGP